MKQIYKDRLLAVARALRESPKPEAFTMQLYAYGPNRYDAEHPCGTPACALGHYASRADLQKEFVIVGHSVLFADESRRGIAHYDSEEVMEHFGLSLNQASLLFNSQGCGGAKTVEEAAQFIEDFVNGNLPDKYLDPDYDNYDE